MLTLAHVKRYIELGFVIHPCCPADHRCASPGKIPFDPVEGKHMEEWQKHRQYDLEWWAERLDYDSSINIGFLCGSPSSLVGVDVDSEEGQALLERSEISGWQDTWRYTTGRGNRYLFRVHQAAGSFKLTGGDSFIEVLGDGRQSVLPPSEHPNGRQYRWCAGYSPRDGSPVVGGDWAQSGGGGGRGSVEITSDREDWAKTIQQLTREGARNETLTRLAGHLMNPAPSTAEETYIWLSLYNQKFCNPPLPDRELRTIIKSISKREAAQEAIRRREIQEIAKTHGVSVADAEMMWRQVL